MLILPPTSIYALAYGPSNNCFADFYAHLPYKVLGCLARGQLWRTRLAFRQQGACSPSYRHRNTKGLEIEVLILDFCCAGRSLQKWASRHTQEDTLICIRSTPGKASYTWQPSSLIQTCCKKDRVAGSAARETPICKLEGSKLGVGVCVRKPCLQDVCKQFFRPCCSSIGGKPGRPPETLGRR